MRLEHRVCIVTGAASGIGRSITKRFLNEGANVVLFDLNGAALEEMAKELSAYSKNVLVAQGSVDDEVAVETTIETTLKQWARIDALVTAAAHSIGGAALQTTIDDWDRVMSINVKGTFLWCKAVLPTFLDRKSGTIITLASQLALNGGRGNASYVASKGAVISLTKSIALDYAPNGIRANVLVPAAIETPLLRRSFARHPDPAAVESRSLARHPMGRFGLPSEVAAAAAFLASDDSSFTTGSILAVDGGWLVG